MKSKRFITSILTLVLMAGLCLGLCGCGEKVSLHGSPQAYTNKAGSVSIDLPSSGEDSWVETEGASTDLLNLTHKRGTINVQLLCLSKKSTAKVAKDLDGFQDYVLKSVFSGFAADAGELTDDAGLDLPEFAKDGRSYEYSYTKEGMKVRGYFVLIESDGCFEACLITPTAETFSANKSAIKDMITSIKEL